MGQIAALTRMRKRNRILRSAHHRRFWPLGDRVGVCCVLCCRRAMRTMNACARFLQVQEHVRGAARAAEQA